MTITQLEGRLKKIDVQAAVDEAIENTSAEYAALNTSQISEGTTSEGGQIEPSTYSPAYARTREREGLQTEYVDLRRTGNFYEGFTVEANGDKIELSSNVEYEKFISKRYGSEIYGLDQENLAKYREILKPVLAEIINQQMT